MHMPQDIIDTFNVSGIITNKVYLNNPEVWVACKGTPWAGQKLLVEPFISNFQKFNSNSGVTCGDEEGWGGKMQVRAHDACETEGSQCMSHLWNLRAGTCIMMPAS